MIYICVALYILGMATSKCLATADDELNGEKKDSQLTICLVVFWPIISIILLISIFDGEE